MDSSPVHCLAFFPLVAGMRVLSIKLLGTDALGVLAMIIWLPVMLCPMRVAETTFRSLCASPSCREALE